MKLRAFPGLSRVLRLRGALAGCLAMATAHAQEFRGLWADTFHAGLRTSSEVSQLVTEARAGHFNAVIVEVRKRGDAYYNSLFEPKATDVSPQSFDPLADLIAKAHNTNVGPRLEVHAWMVTYNIWNNQTTLPAQPNHPYRLHPDWLTQTSAGTTWDGDNYAFDPGHPDVQRHTLNVALDIVTRYDVDGLHFDYIRYAGREWGYHPVAVQRFQARYNRTGVPSETDPQWLQFRRDQVTALVRKVYLSAIAAKPQVKISAATITWAPGITTDAEWPGSAAYADVLQDWRAWMQEGILDLNIPMAYFRQHTVNSNDWAKWSQFTKDHRYRRHAAIGAAIYLNTVSNSIVQFRSTRTATPAGHRADGMVGYSYAVVSSEGVPRSTFLAALTQPSSYDPNPVPIFTEVVDPPVMTWKSAPTYGHLMGYVTHAAEGIAIDGATVSVTGPTNRTLLTDATGFFGAVDLPPGDYALTASQPGLESQSAVITVATGTVARHDFALPLPAGVAFFRSVRISPGTTSALVGWSTERPAVAWLEYGVSTNSGLSTPHSPSPAATHERLLTGLAPSTDYFLQLVATEGAQEYRSAIYALRTAGELIVDNPFASFAGPWSIGTSSSDKYSTNYHYARTVSGAASATATYRPYLGTPGTYDVFVWYPQGSNRSAAAPFSVTDRSGTVAVAVNQTSGGGGWRLLTANRSFGAGTNGFVRLSNNTSEAEKVVLADAVKFSFVAGQDPPPAGTVPEWWARHYFGGPADGALDPDGDGFSNHAEYVIGTAPDDATARLQLGVESAQEVPQLRFAPFHQGRRYQLEAVDQLVPPSWRVLTTLVPTGSVGGEGSFADTNGIVASRFYRLRVELVP